MDTETTVTTDKDIQISIQYNIPRQEYSITGFRLHGCSLLAKTLPIYVAQNYIFTNTLSAEGVQNAM